MQVPEQRDEEPPQPPETNGQPKGKGKVKKRPAQSNAAAAGKTRRCS